MKKTIYTLSLAIMSLLGTAQTIDCNNIQIEVSDTTMFGYGINLSANTNIPVNLYDWRAYNVNDQNWSSNSFYWSNTDSVAWFYNMNNNSFQLDTLTYFIANLSVDNGTGTNSECFIPFIIEVDALGDLRVNTMMVTSIEEAARTNKKVIGVYNMLGQPVNNSAIKNEILIVVYSDKTMTKILNK